MQITLRGQNFTVDSAFEESIGVYGKPFWEKVGSSNYEIDTFTFIEKSFSKGKRKFVDIGAATGCMSLFAASLGYEVVALEPQADIYEALKRNVALNPDLSTRIDCREVLLTSGYKGLNEREFFTEGAEGPLSTVVTSLVTLDALDLLVTINGPIGFSLKMDIEGAEFSLLRDVKLLEFLKTGNSILFLSFHPGFQRPLPPLANIIQKLLWRFSTLNDTNKFVTLLTAHSRIAFKNEDKFLSRIGVVWKIVRGERDFTLYF